MTPVIPTCRPLLTAGRVAGAALLLALIGFGVLLLA